jgi:hypothetical protein
MWCYVVQTSDSDDEGAGNGEVVEDDDGGSLIGMLKAIVDSKSSRRLHRLRFGL